MNEHTLFLRKIALITGSVAAVVVAYGAYVLFSKNAGTKLPIQQTVLTVQEKIAVLNQLANASSTGALSVSGKEKILNALQKKKTNATTTSSADKMKLLQSLAP